MLSLLLAQKIFELFLYLVLGFILVKAKVLQEKDTLVLSRVCLYLYTPCVILSAFQVELTDRIRSGLLVGFLAAILIHFLYIGIGTLFHHRFQWSSIETTAITYTNCGNLIIPLVSSVLGEEWVIFVTAYVSVFNFFVWTHGRYSFAGKGHISMKDLFLNINLIMIAIGLVMLIAGLRITGIPYNVTRTMGSMLGPMSMVVTGMVLGAFDFRKILTYRRLPVICLMRMIVMPLIVLLLLKISGAAGRIVDGRQILMITFLAAMAPSAATVNQFAILYDRDAKYASAINIVTTLLCIVTMPAMLFLYEKIM